MFCPLETSDYNECLKKDNECAWYCEGEKCCAIKVLALMAIKKDEK